VKDLLQKRTIVIVLGTGGVGKTTVAAALGIAGAQTGLDTALITVDPARRLRDALGLSRLGGDPVRLRRNQLAGANLEPSLRLSAMMLDVKGAWDGLVERLVPNASSRKRILSNPFYQRLTAEFAGSEAFAAMQQIYNLHRDQRFELEIVDTPPAAHAFEFLEAPARFTRLLDSRGARWIFAPSLSAGRVAVKLASQAARFVLRELERFAGGQVLSTISDFFAAAAESVDAVVDQLRKTEQLMRSSAVRFVLVTTTQEDRLRQARELIAEMSRDGLKLAAIIVNRFLDERTMRKAIEGPGSGALRHLDEIPKLSEVMRRNAAPHSGHEELIRHLGRYRSLRLTEVKRVAAFARSLPSDLPLILAPELGEGGDHNLGTLARVSGFIADGTPALRALEAAAPPDGIVNLASARRGVKRF